jgi:hypothetical protein
MFESLFKDRVTIAADNFQIIARLQPNTGRHLKSSRGFPLPTQAKEIT